MSTIQEVHTFLQDNLVALARELYAPLNEPNPVLNVFCQLMKECPGKRFTDEAHRLIENACVERVAQGVRREDLTWVVNNDNELCIKVYDKVFSLYKGEPLLHEKAFAYRKVGSREFGVSGPISEEDREAHDWTNHTGTETEKVTEPTFDEVLEEMRKHEEGLASCRAKLSLIVQKAEAQLK